MYSCRDSSYVSLIATCRGICFIHPVPTSTSPPKTSGGTKAVTTQGETSSGTKAVTTQGKTSSEHKSNTLSGKVTIDHVSIVDFKICRRAISILCSFVSLKIAHLVKYSVISATALLRICMWTLRENPTPPKKTQKTLKIKYSKPIISRDLEKLTSLLLRRNQQRKFSRGFLFIRKSF